ncbi:MAG: hypothetical protein ACI4LZ_04660 [Anaerovoracaceae bacterium]
MSIMCCVYIPEGIVLAADSRLTRTKTGNIGEIPETEKTPKTVLIPQTTYTSSDNTQKVMLIKKSNVGISFCGNAIINGATVADFIRRFEIEKVSPEHTTEQIAYNLADYYNGNDTHFFVCGYDSDIPYVYDVYRKHVKRSNIADVPQNNSGAKDVADDGQEELIETGIPDNMKKQSEDVANNAPVEPVVIYGATWAGQMTAITKVVNNAPSLNADWGAMPLKEAIDFAEFLIDTTIKYERFCDDIQTCGGDIDILVITKDEAFWKQHKIFNPKR